MTFQQKYSDDDIISIIEEYNDIATSTDIMEELKCTKATANMRLRNLVTSGQVVKINKGSQKKPFFIYSRGNKHE